MALQTYQLVITGNLAGQFVQNVFHYRMDDAAFPTRLAAAKGLIDGWIAANKDEAFVDLCPANYTMLSVKARCLTDGGGPEWLDLSVGGNSGDRSGNAGTSSSGPVIIWYTDGSPRHKGKTFVPGISNSDVEDGEISSAAITAFLSAATTFRANFNSVGASVVAVVFVIAEASNPATRHAVVQQRISIHIGQQRRRQLPV